MMDVAEAYSKHSAGVLRYLRSWTRDEALAEDICSAVFEQAVRHEGDVDNWRSWLLTVARNTLTSHNRRRKTVPILDDGWQIAGSVNVEKTVLARLEIASVKEALAYLTDRERQVITARAVVGPNLHEIAAVTGLSRGAICAAGHRGKVKLRGLMDGTISPRPLKAKRLRRVPRPPLADPAPPDLPDVAGLPACIGCGLPRDQWPWPRTRKATYCSDNCAEVARLDRRWGRRLTAPCEGCGMARDRWPIKRRRDARFCSHGCCHIFYQKNARNLRGAVA